MVESVDTQDLKSCDHWLCGFKSRSGYFFKNSSSSFIARIAQLVEHDLAKVGVASSSLVSRSKKHFKKLRCFFISTKYFKDMDAENYFVYVLSSMVTNKFHVGMLF